MDVYLWDTRKDVCEQQEADIGKSCLVYKDHDTAFYAYIFIYIYFCLHFLANLVLSKFPPC